MINFQQRLEAMTNYVGGAGNKSHNNGIGETGFEPGRVRTIHDINTMNYSSKFVGGSEDKGRKLL